MADSEAMIEAMSDEECASLLAATHFGRLVVVSDGQPTVFPVNYVYASGRIAIRTDPGTKLTAAALSRVAFEIDQIDEAERSGWSVVVHGTGHDISDSVDEVSSLMRDLPVETWAPGEKASWIRIEPSSVTGRRVRRA